MDLLLLSFYGKKKLRDNRSFFSRIHKIPDWRSPGFLNLIIPDSTYCIKVSII